MDPAAAEDLLRAHERARADLVRATVELRELVATGIRLAAERDLVPLKTPKGDAQGVLQLVNRRPEPAWRFASPAAMVREAVPSPARSRDLAVALAALGAVAPENSRRYAGGRAALAAVDASQRRIIQSERLWVEDPLVRGQREIIDGAQTVRRTQEVARMRRMWPFRTVDLAKPLDLDEAAVDEGAVRVEETLARAAPAGG
jgi:hypothetical protein